MNKKIRTPAVETLFEAIIQLKTVDECFDFFEDLATINEILSLSQRFEVARMLRQHKTYLENRCIDGDDQSCEPLPELWK